jgi:hypothetical protein
MRTSWVRFPPRALPSGSSANLAIPGASATSGFSSPEIAVRLRDIGKEIVVIAGVLEQQPLRSRMGSPAVEQPFEVGL